MDELEDILLVSGESGLDHDDHAAASHGDFKFSESLAGRLVTVTVEPDVPVLSKDLPTWAPPPDWRRRSCQ